MPTAADYEHWADRLIQLQPGLGSLLYTPLCLATPETLRGGSLSVLVDVTLRASHDNSYEAMLRLQTLADECRSRAAICRAFDAEWATYESQLAAHDAASERRERLIDDAGSPTIGIGLRPLPDAPTPPPLPAAWVDRSV
ncbi:MAG: hypothetical protein ACK5OX_16005 [Desertimonas sp.]